MTESQGLHMLFLLLSASLGKVLCPCLRRHSRSRRGGIVATLKNRLDACSEWDTES